MSDASFSCQRCGLCCYGNGGIVIGEKDLPGLLSYFNIDEETFLKQFTFNSNGKPCLISGLDGYCYFFKKNVGCTIHDARPHICRAWPYFRGNLIDESSFEIAKEDCAGIVKTVSHTEFAYDGYTYLTEHNLLASNPKKNGHALIIQESELPKMK